VAVSALAIDAIRAAWAGVSGRLGAYGLLLPGSASFVCQAELCQAHCCRSFSVSLGDGEVARMAATGRQPITFLETEKGEPISLPLAQPYLLARRHGQCALLGRDLRCTAYEGRPDACRRYPHEVVFAGEGGLVRLEPAEQRAALEATVAGRAGSPLALLLGHRECPGFTGPALTLDGWAARLRETLELQLAGH
jgi:Fe-S-cluster containining protein